MGVAEVSHGDGQGEKDHLLHERLPPRLGSPIGRRRGPNITPAGPEATRTGPTRARPLDRGRPPRVSCIPSRCPHPQEDHGDLMTNRRPRTLTLVAPALLVLAMAPLCLASLCLADEGMWTLDDFPKQVLKDGYGFEPSDSWLEHVRLSSARLARGCSASFVSSSGLVMTNYHCVTSCIEE